MKYRIITIILIIVITLSIQSIVNSADQLQWFKCPLCGQEFEAWARIAYTTIGYRLDSKPDTFDSWPKPLAVCPKDHFIVFKQEFNNEEITILHKYIESNEYQAMVDSLNDYYLLGKILEKLNASPSKIGNAYLNASWIAEYDDIRLYRFYTERALEEFSKIIHDMPNYDYEVMQTKVLCGELARKLGNYKEAKEKTESAKEDIQRIMDYWIYIIECEEKLIGVKDTLSHYRSECDTL